MNRLSALLAAVLMILVTLLSGCGNERSSARSGTEASQSEPAETPDPHEGMVQVSSSFGTLMWAPKYDDVPRNTLNPSDFTEDGQYIRYNGSDVQALYGIDVSEHQGEIDWAQAAGSGVEFAMIRAGYRGYTEGTLNTDYFFERNIQDAAAQGIRIGVYFFSQAVSAAEAEEEAEYLMNLMAPYRSYITMPVVFDWENLDGEDARTDDVSGEELTDFALAFCARLAETGYDPAIYAYRFLGYYSYELPRLNGIKLWISAINAAPDFYYLHHMWQYSIEGSIPGIQGDVDLDMAFVYPEN